MRELINIGRAGDRGPAISRWLWQLNEASVVADISTQRNVLQYEARPATDGLEKYQKRIEFLDKEAAIEGFSMNDDSLRDFSRFVDRNLLISRGALMMNEDGLLELIWQDRRCSRLSLEFVGGGRVNFVFLSELDNNERSVHIMGHDLVDRVVENITTIDAAKLLFN